MAFLSNNQQGFGRDPPFWGVRVRLLENDRLFFFYCNSSGNSKATNSLLTDSFSKHCKSLAFSRTKVLPMIQHKVIPTPLTNSNYFYDPRCQPLGNWNPREVVCGLVGSCQEVLSGRSCPVLFPVNPPL